MVSFVVGPTIDVGLFSYEVLAHPSVFGWSSHQVMIQKDSLRVKNKETCQLILTNYRTLTRFWPHLTRLWHSLAVLFSLMGRNIGYADKFTAHFCQTQAAFLDAKGPKMASERARSPSEYGTLFTIINFLRFSLYLLQFSTLKTLIHTKLRQML